MCHTGSAVVFDVTAKGSLEMQIGSATKWNAERARMLKFVLCSLNIYRARNKRYISVMFRNRWESGALKGGTKGTSRRIADLIGGI